MESEYVTISQPPFSTTPLQIGYHKFFYLTSIAFVSGKVFVNTAPFSAMLTDEGAVFWLFPELFHVEHYFLRISMASLKSSAPLLPPGQGPAFW